MDYENENVLGNTFSITGSLLLSAVSEARIITGTAEYYVDNTSRVEIEKVALESAKREALEQAGVYIESESLVKNNALEKDAVKAITIGTTKLVNNSIKKQYSQENGREKLTLTAKFDIDEKEVRENLKRVIEQKDLLALFEQEMNTYTEQLLKYEYLKAVSDFNVDQDENLLTEQEKKYLFEYMQLGTIDGLQECISYAYGSYVYGKYKRAEQIYKMIIDNAGSLKFDDGTEKNFYGHMYEMLAEIRLKLNDYAGAETYVDKALSYDAGRTKAMVQKGEILSARGASIDERLKHAEKIGKTYYAAGYSSKALILMDACRYKEAVDSLNKAIFFVKSHPNEDSRRHLSVLYDNLGQVYRKVSDYKNAEKSYKKGIELDPDNMNILNSLGCLYETMKYYSKAYDAFDRIVKYIPVDGHTDWNSKMKALAYFNRGNIAMYMKKYEDALQDYDMATKLDPNLENVYVMKKKVEKMRRNEN